MKRFNRIALVICCGLVWLLAGLAYPVLPYPELELYQGETSFSGHNAYLQLQQLVTQFPARTVWSAADRQSADWVAAEFGELGFQVSSQEFSTRAQLDYLEPRAAATSSRLQPSGFATVSGSNVLGFLPGTSPETVVRNGGDSPHCFKNLLHNIPRTIAEIEAAMTKWPPGRIIENAALALQSGISPLTLDENQINPLAIGLDVARIPLLTN